MIRKLRVYVAGPLSGSIPCYLGNVYTMLHECHKVEQAGMAPYCPAHDILYGLTGGFWSYQRYIDFNIPWLLVSDVMYCYGDHSPGVNQEIRIAAEHNIPVVKDWGALCEFKRAWENRDDE